MKIVNKNLSENSNDYRRVRDALFNPEKSKIKSFAIVSPENPLAWKDCTDEDRMEKYIKWTKDPHKYNAEARNELKKYNPDYLKFVIQKNGEKTLRIGGFHYVEIKGSYGDRERSYMIFNIPNKDAEAIARGFGQESYFYAKINEDGLNIAYYKTNNCCKTYELVEVSQTVTNEEDAEDFFSKFGVKFRINMKEFGDDIPEIIDPEEFEKSMDEHFNFMSRAQHRKTAYKNKV